MMESLSSLVLLRNKNEIFFALKTLDNYENDTMKEL